ncbi:MAG: 5-methyltetrahydropteroyltriglutamate--homocysteine S-methyltransferase [Sebaldella sp.]|nr:5-methyltetrahydropteroyltriglutamate--homocysteine S-methyltransferase [Sebaldella sp.]
MKIATIGFPRIGENRELKKSLEGYFNEKISKENLLEVTRILKEKHWKLQSENKIDYISSNDFSLYDNVLDTYQLFDLLPNEYKRLDLNEIDTYIALARGYQKDGKDIKSLEMKKWFNTNYHYVVPIINDDSIVQLKGNKLFKEYQEAKKIGITTKPVIVGPFTFLKLSRIKLEKKTFEQITDGIIKGYTDLFNKLKELKIEFLQLDEPYLVKDLDSDEKKLFLKIYKTLLKEKGDVKILLQTYFGDIRDIYSEIIKLDIDALGLDFVDGSKNLELIEENGFPEGKILFAGIVNGRNIWKNDYKNSLDILKKLSKKIKKDRLVLNTSCSLLHSPYTLRNEKKLDEKYKNHLSFAEEKLTELREIAELFDDKNYKDQKIYLKNQKAINQKANDSEYIFSEVRKKIKNLSIKDFRRKKEYLDREKIQEKELKLPLLPTTTIGSFPQTSEVRKLRRDYKNNIINEKEYIKKIEENIKNVINLQEKIGLDVLVHGEYERNDMVEYFGENLTGYIFTENGWVQSYGTRGVKPPIIFGDIKREKDITVSWTKYAQSLTDKPVKGMLTGPITMLAWSFPRVDIKVEEITYQLALAIREEVLELEKQGIKIIQIDEPALREKLPLRKSEWDAYLDWATKSFRYTNSGIKDKTQIHTHMCYSEFEEIIEAIENLDSDVITIETAKSDLSMLDVLKKNKFPSQVGPGVFDIHTSRIPPVNEIKKIIDKMVSKLDYKKLWINPDCGLKTRTDEQVEKALINMVEARNLKIEELNK